jgi:hypothetical protein
VNKTPIRKEEKGMKERLIFFLREPETEKKHNNTKESTMRTMKARKAMYPVALMAAAVALLILNRPSIKRGKSQEASQGSNP